MINVILEYILLGYIPILFFVAIILRGREKKDDQFYWGSKIQEKSSFANDISIFFLYWNCIFRKNCASVPEERSAIPLQTEQSSAG